MNKLKNEIIELNRDADTMKKAGTEEMYIEPPRNSYKATEGNLKEILDELKEKLPESLNKRLGVDRALRYIDKRKIETINDMRAIRSQLTAIRNDYGNRIDAINDYINSMNSIYDKLLRKSREVNTLEKEFEELGIFKFKQKNLLNERIQELKNEINELKESEFYQKDIRYSDKMEELKGNREEYLTVLKKCENENSILYDIEMLSKDKEKLLSNLNKDKNNEINIKIKRHSNDLEL